MIGGQVVDLEAEHTRPTAEMLEYIHRSKTAALITASLVSGGLYGGAKDGEVAHLRAFGMGIGLAFQIVDDVLDVTQTSEQLGKTAGKDTASEKATYPALFGIDASVAKRMHWSIEAFAELQSFGERAETLKELARYLVERKKLELSQDAHLNSPSVLLCDLCGIKVSTAMEFAITAGHDRLITPTNIKTDFVGELR